jgi:pSer/pThr/pTyr-binding forkhead associated (FHA) protein/EAL domain-containing protein (putative c-di-GMP-specific phosphodiesterase class I)
MPTPKPKPKSKSSASASKSKRPSFEFFPRPGEAPQRVTLDPLPFTIGRIDTADLQVDSTRVSRQHAQIVLENGRFVLRDLGSTNGTYVNGKQVESAVLADGDTVLIADFELTFVAAAGDRIRRMATQLMTGVQAPHATSPGFGDEVDDLRRMHEILLQGLVFPEVGKIVTLPDKAPFAIYAQSPLAEGGAHPLPLESLNYSHPSHPSVRYHELHRALAQEAAMESSGHEHLMVDVATWEIEVNAALPRHLAKLADLWPTEDALTVCLAAESVADLDEVARFCEELHGLGISICYRDFVGSGSQVLQFRELPPDYLMLAPAMLRAGLRRDPQNQKLKSVLAACQELGCRPILTDDDGHQIDEALDDLECDLAWIRRPQRAAPAKSEARELAFAV